MKILYTGPIRPGSTTEARVAALKNLGHEVVDLDQRPFIDRGPALIRKLKVHSLLGPEIHAYNVRLLSLARACRPDMVYADQSPYLYPHVVDALHRHAPTLVHDTSEYFRFQRHWYRRLFRAIPLYDIHVITNPLNIPILRTRRARKIVLTEFGYNPEVHVPVELSAEDIRRHRVDAVFIGHWERNTEMHIRAMRDAGIQVRVWGGGWHRANSLADRREICPLPPGEYCQALAAARLCLCFLSRHNHNTSAGRTFEIPAIGGFLLAERTAQHSGYFTEGKDAEFFASPQELVEKARHYLQNEGLRMSVAAAGHARCMTSDYSLQDRMRSLIERIMR